jgi:hypothetical protein
MAAFARLQFEDLTESNREAIRAALLKYCELDTLALVRRYRPGRTGRMTDADPNTRAMLSVRHRYGFAADQVRISAAQKHL